MSLAIDPPACTVPAAGGKSKHSLMNGSEAKIIIKVKCTNNTEYRMNPVYAFIDPAGKIDLEVTRLVRFSDWLGKLRLTKSLVRLQEGPAKEDKAVIQFGPSPEDATDPTIAWPSIPPEQIQSATLPLSATA
ncbi:unnamed protein product [Strongylus vulgaris]|uniref:Major sperm protein n=1 Tax=Strongylus vulgaris TaxID=40348 RepID=A0A3P7IH45_STRVU|nr:unnamed protein product [Strongylus vulgaris]